MKRVKVLLMTFTVLGVVGVALAFKVKPTLVEYCGSTTNGGTCTTFFSKAGSLTDPIVFTTDTWTETNCPTRSCKTGIRLTID